MSQNLHNDVFSLFSVFMNKAFSVSGLYRHQSLFINLVFVANRNLMVKLLKRGGDQHCLEIGLLNT